MLGMKDTKVFPESVQTNYGSNTIFRIDVQFPILAESLLKNLPVPFQVLFQH